MASRLVERSDYVREAQKLRDQGMSVTEIAAYFDVARSTASAWLCDPDLSKQRKRRERYAGTCEKCGGATDGSAGFAKAPKICAACYVEENRAEHGTISRYQSGCGCDECRAANAARMRQLVGKEPPNHGASGYQNYGCRCDICKEGNYQYHWLRGWEAQKRWMYALPCPSCGGRMNRKNNKSGLCRACWVASRRAA